MTNFKSIVHNLINDVILKITCLVLIVSLFIGPPKIQDINTHTIFSLFALMISVQLLKHLNVLEYINQWLINKAADNQKLVQFLVILAFFSSMFLTNDVAILTIIPLYLSIALKQKFKIALPLTLITIAANLGSMGTPFGNPQNIFLISYYHWPLSTFILVVIPVLIISLVFLIAFTHLIPKNQIKLNDMKPLNLNIHAIIFVLLSMSIVLLGIFNVINIFIAIGINIFIAMFIYRRIFYQIDYGLLLTLSGFFLIVGILSRNQVVYSMVQFFVDSNTNTYFTSIISSQFISNVPAAILLSKFTDQILPIFLGVNIGGLGTIIASLANLITLKQIISFDSKAVKSFLKTFLVINLILLVLMAILGLLLMKILK